MRIRVPDPRLLVVVSATLLGAAIAFPLGVIASHQFTDVPTSSTYHNDIDAIRDAGVTTGCALNLYCPKDFVTREQMAAFLNRLGALGPGKTPVVNATKIDGLNSTQFARSDVATTGYYQCGSRETLPKTADLPWATSANRFLYLTAGISGSFSCGIHLPNGSTITALTLDGFDGSSTETVSCQLLRWEFGSANDGVPLAGAETGVSENPLVVTVTDATIETPIVDTELFVYATDCTITGNGTDIGLYGTRITYTVAGLPVE